MKQLSILLFVCALFIRPLSAGVDPARAAQDAMKFYEAAQYKSAIKVYEDIIRNGTENAGILYNLGNAYYKDGQPAKSILNYERALILSPGDEAAKRNILIARARTRDKVEPMPLLFIIQWWNTIKMGYTTRTLFHFSLLFMWLFAAAIFVFFGIQRVLIRRFALVAAIGLFGILAANIFLIIDRNEEITGHRNAIIMAQEVMVKSAPDASGVDSFAIHAGLKVQIIETKDTWSKIRLADGKTGWISLAHLERI